MLDLIGRTYMSNIQSLGWSGGWESKGRKKLFVSTDLLTETGSSCVIQMLYGKNRSLEIKEQGLFVCKKRAAGLFWTKRKGM